MFGAQEGEPYSFQKIVNRRQDAESWREREKGKQRTRPSRLYKREVCANKSTGGGKPDKTNQVGSKVEPSYKKSQQGMLVGFNEVLKEAGESLQRELQTAGGR